MGRSGWADCGERAMAHNPAKRKVKITKMKKTNWIQTETTPKTVDVRKKMAVRILPHEGAAKTKIENARKYS